MRIVASTSSAVIQSGVPAGTMLQAAPSATLQSFFRLLRDMTGHHHRRRKKPSISAHRPRLPAAREDDIGKGMPGFTSLAVTLLAGNAATRHGRWPRRYE